MLYFSKHTWRPLITHVLSVSAVKLQQPDCFWVYDTNLSSWLVSLSSLSQQLFLTPSCKSQQRRAGRECLNRTKCWERKTWSCSHMITWQRLTNSLQSEQEACCHSTVLVLGSGCLLWALCLKSSAVLSCFFVFSWDSVNICRTMSRHVSPAGRTSRAVLVSAGFSCSTFQPRVQRESELQTRSPIRYHPSVCRLHGLILTERWHQTCVLTSF